MKSRKGKSAESAPGESSGEKFAIKLPVQLVKRLSDGPLGEMRWQIEVPDGLIHKGIALDLNKGRYFLLLGALSEESDIARLIQ